MQYAQVEGGVANEPVGTYEERSGMDERSMDGRMKGGRKEAGGK